MVSCYNWCKWANVTIVQQVARGWGHLREEGVVDEEQPGRRKAPYSLPQA